MMNLSRLLAAAVLVATWIPTLVLAQTAGASSSAPTTNNPSSPTPSSPSPSGGVATGKSAVGEETPTQRQAQEKMKKDTTICKAC